MASTCMHLLTGYRFAQKTGRVSDPPQFYLGCVAPDSVNVDGFAEKEKRWAAHLRDRDLDVWYRNIAAFYINSVKSAGDPALLLGYAVHCITDVAWDEAFHDRVWKAMRHIGLPPMTEMGLGWDDCFRFDHDQFPQPWWTGKVRPALESAVARPIHVVTEELLERYRLDVLLHYAASIPEGGPRMVSAEMVDHLADIVCRRCESLLP